MKINHSIGGWVLSLGILLAMPDAAKATLVLDQVLFAQDFTASTDINDYVGTDDNEFNAIGASGGTSNVGIVSNALRISIDEGDGNTGWATRSTTQFSPPPLILEFKANVGIGTISNSNNEFNSNRLAAFQFGDAIGATSPVALPNAYFTLDIASNTSGQWHFRNPRDGATSSNFDAGTMAGLTIYLNNSGSSFTLTGPDSNSYTLTNDQFVVFANSSIVGTVSDVVDAKTQDLTHFGIYAQSRATAIRFLDFDFTVDNVNIATIPEPSTLLLLLGGTLLLFCRRFIHYRNY